MTLTLRATPIGTTLKWIIGIFWGLSSLMSVILGKPKLCIIKAWSRMFMRWMIKDKDRTYKITKPYLNGLNKKRLMCVLLKDTVDMDLIRKLFNFNSSITSRNLTLKCTLHMAFPIPIRKWKVLSMRLSKVIKTSSESKNSVSL